MSAARIFKEIERRAQAEDKFEAGNRAFCVTVALANGEMLFNADYIDVKPNEGYVHLSLSANDTRVAPGTDALNRHVMIPLDQIVYVRPTWL